MKKKLINSIAISVSVFGICLPLANFAASHSYSRKLSKESIAEQLQWVATNDPHNICHGYFVQPMLDADGKPILPPAQSNTQLSADQGSFSQKAESMLSGNVVVLQPGRRLTANHAVIYPGKKGKYKAVRLTGDVRAYEPGQLMIADSAYFNLLKNTGILRDVKYRVLLASKDDIPQRLTPVGKDKEKLDGTVAWGQAKEVRQPQPKHTNLTKVTYTTCAPDAAQWKLLASKMHLNKKTEMGDARNVWLNFEGLPLFYTPYISFPLSKKRKSGFLFPLIGATNISGFEFGLPYYWNIAPNYDDTFTPTYYSKRGILFNNKFRYLTHHSYGEVEASFLPNDREFKSFKKSARTKYADQPGLNSLLNDSDNRYAVSLKNNTQFDPNWNGLVDYAYVSDDYYLQDFGTIPEQISTNNVSQKAQIQYRDEHWVFTGLVQGYQTLHPVNRVFIPNAYSMLPQLSLDGNYPNIWKNLDFSLKSQGTYFQRKSADAPAGSTTPITNPNGGRFEVRPGLSLPYNWIWGFADPEIQDDITYYSLTGQPTTYRTHITRNIPIFSFHSGLYFDRDVHIHHQAYEQTLQPEIFYLYKPYRRQNDIPNFDTGFIPFDYNQLFSIRRFSGLDRISDANQLSYALTTRFINSNTGEEKFRFSIGEAYYFKEPRVQVISTKSSNLRDADFYYGLGVAPTDERFSPIATLMSYHFNPAWSMNGGYSWDPTIHKSITGSFYFSYNPGLNQIINFGYSYLRNGDVVNVNEPGSSENNLDQINVNGAWPISDRWSAVAIFNYNISQDHPQTYLGGFEYNTCCIRLRFLGGRVFSNIDQNGKFVMQNAFYFQIQFKGLGNIGDNNLSSLLTNNINNYEDPFSSNSFGNFSI